MRERIAPRAYPGRVPPWPSQLSLDTQACGLTAEDTQAVGLTVVAQATLQSCCKVFDVLQGVWFLSFGVYGM